MQLDPFEFPFVTIQIRRNRVIVIQSQHEQLIIGLPLIERSEYREAVLINSAAIVIQEWEDTDAQADPLNICQR